MKVPRPFGTIRLLAPSLGRGRRRWRGGPLVPMIWRRLLHVRPASAQKAAGRSSSAPAPIFNLSLVWPAPAAAPIRTLEARIREIVRAGRDGRNGDAGRLAASIERLSLRSPQAAAPAAPAAAVRRAITAARQGARTPQPPQAEGRAEAETVPLLWPRLGKTLPLPADSDRPFARAAGAGAMRVWPGARAAAAVADGVVAAPLQARPPMPMRWRAGAPGKSAATERPEWPRASLIWRGGQAFGAASALPHMHQPTRTDLVWRRPSPALAPGEAGAPGEVQAVAARPAEIQARADRPAGPAASPPSAPAPAAIQPAEMSRLVDEVVRRLERIGRDERMRRGL